MPNGKIKGRNVNVDLLDAKDGQQLRKARSSIFEQFVRTLVEKTGGLRRERERGEEGVLTALIACAL
jgi:hypothetical protein